MDSSESIMGMGLSQRRDEIVGDVITPAASGLLRLDIGALHRQTQSTRRFFIDAQGRIEQHDAIVRAPAAAIET